MVSDIDTNHREIYDQQRKQIAIDNASIQLGEKARDILNGLQKTEQAIATLELAHRTAHFCKNVPITAAQCAATDKALEATIRTKFKVRTKWAEINWVLATRQYLKKQQSLDTTVRHSSGPGRLELKAKRCSICGLKVSWEMASRFDYQLTAEHKPPLEAKMSIRKGKKWNYRLEAR